VTDTDRAVVIGGALLLLLLLFARKKGDEDGDEKALIEPVAWGGDDPSFIPGTYGGLDEPEPERPAPEAEKASEDDEPTDPAYDRSTPARSLDDEVEIVGEFTRAQIDRSEAETAAKSSTWRRFVAIEQRCTQMALDLTAAPPGSAAINAQRAAVRDEVWRVQELAQQGQETEAAGLLDALEQKMAELERTIYGGRLLVGGQ